MPDTGTDHLDFLFDISELTDLVTRSDDINSFLALATDLVAGHFNAPVCSIYLFEDLSKKLILKATKGLNPDAVNSVRMKPGEGLVGASFEKAVSVREGNARANKQFKYFEQAGEDPFNSFLCVPVKTATEKIGVLVVQHLEMNWFSAADERAIVTAAGQLASTLENARLLLALSQMDTSSDRQVPELSFLKGTPASPGIGRGHCRSDHRSFCA